MPVFVDNIAAVRTADKIRKGHGNKSAIILKVQQIAQEIGVIIKNVEGISKPKLKKQGRGKIGKSIAGFDI